MAKWQGSRLTRVDTSGAIGDGASTASSSRHIVPSDGGGWNVSGPTAGQVDSHHATQADAIKSGRATVRKAGGGELVIHGRDGAIRAKETYSFRAAKTSSSLKRSSDQILLATIFVAATSLLGSVASGIYAFQESSGLPTNADLALTPEVLYPIILASVATIVAVLIGVFAVRLFARIRAQSRFMSDWAAKAADDAWRSTAGSAMDDEQWVTPAGTSGSQTDGGSRDRG